jgi:EAL domain-containing protein (putative c-di-GMP-specific phosphodiesterase class I)
MFDEMLVQTPSPPSPAAERRLGLPDAKAEANVRRRMEQDLRQAVAQDAFTMHYQPRVCCRSGRIVGAEALIRWTHRRRGLVSPAYFIPLAEQNGLIVKIGAFGLRTACKEAMSWANPDTVVSVNVSPRQLTDRALLTQVAAGLEESGLKPERLELELTESMLLHVDSDTLFALSALRDLGVGLALDDFGTGYASLGMLRRLPLTAMKIDRSLVRDLPDDREDVAIARAAVQTGHAMGLRVVAEGVETEAQRDFLAAIGCDEGQGYLFARPMPADQIRPAMAA